MNTETLKAYGTVKLYLQSLSTVGMEVSTQFHVHVALIWDKQPPIPVGTPAVWALKLVQTLWKTEKSLIPIR